MFKGGVRPEPLPAPSFAGMEEVFVYDAVRTPRARGGAQGAFREVRPFRLPSKLLLALRERHPGLDPAAVTDVLLGCASPLGDQGYNVAQAALQDAGWPSSVAAATVSRYRAAGLESVYQAVARISAGLDGAIVAGGVESVSRVPLGAGGGALLEDPDLILGRGTLPHGIAADLVATLRGYGRERLDAYALDSHRRAAEASAGGRFADSLVAVRDRSGIPLLDRDEGLREGLTAESLASLPAAFAKTVPARGGALPSEGFDALARARYPQLAEVCHVHTGGNAAAPADGAALALLGTVAFGKANGLTPRARLLSVALASSEPTVMLLGLLPAAEAALTRADVTADGVDVFEVDETFAALPLALAEHLGVELARVNVNGGAIAHGHAAGAEGTALLAAAVDELHRRGARYGLVAVSAAGGQGMACVVERV